MVPYRGSQEVQRFTALRRTFSSRRWMRRMAGSVGLVVLAFLFLVGVVFALDIHSVWAAFALFFGAISSLVVSGLLFLRGLSQLARWRAIGLGIEMDPSFVPGESSEIRVVLQGRKRVANVAVILATRSSRVPLGSIADLGRDAEGSEGKTLRVTLPRELPDGAELELIADDMRADPLVQRFALPRSG